MKGKRFLPLLADTRAVVRAIVCAMVCLGSHAHAQSQGSPLSIIDWLGGGGAGTSAPDGRSRGDPAQGDPARGGDFDVELPAPSSTRLPSVTASPLEDTLEDGAGILSLDGARFPDNLWAFSNTDELMDALSQVPNDLRGEARDLFYSLLLLRATPPQDAGTTGRWLAARVDRLVQMGALEQAYALLDTAAPRQPALFERYFDVAVLLDRPEKPCAALLANPALSTDTAKRVFCFAREGDWSLAALTLQTASVLGDLSQDTAYLLTAYLEPAFADEVEFGPVEGEVSALEFHLRDVIGYPLALDNLPLAYRVSALDGSAGWSEQLTAAERLARTGAIQSQQLFDIYIAIGQSVTTTAGEAAEEAALERARTMTRLKDSFDEDDQEATAAAIREAWRVAVAGGYAHEFATYWAQDIARVALNRNASAPLRELYSEIGYFSGLERSHALAGGAQNRALARIALGQTPLSGQNLRHQAVIRSLNRRTLTQRLTLLQSENKIGEALLVILSEVARAQGGDFSMLDESISGLRGFGFEEHARRIGLDFWVGV